MNQNGTHDRLTTVDQSALRICTRLITASFTYHAYDSPVSLSWIGFDCKVFGAFYKYLSANEGKTFEKIVKQQPYK